MAHIETHKGHSETQAQRGAAHVFPLLALGWSLSLFAAISYALCVLFYVLSPTAFGNHAVLALFLPWVKVLTWPGFFLGLVSSLVCGWYVALVFGPLYNYFAARVR